MADILLLNGPNLNLLGEREPDIYGHTTLADIEAGLVANARGAGFAMDCFQSNHEGALVDRVQQARGEGVRFVIVNPGAYGHTSIALRDAFEAVRIPFIEVHISNIHARESFRHHSHLSALAVGMICGLGVHGYALALAAAVDQLSGG